MADPLYDANEEILAADMQLAEAPEQEVNDIDQDFLNAIQMAESTAYGSDSDSELAEDRARAIDDYLGQPYGNEVVGKSQVVSRDVHDTIEWIKPSLLRIFTSGDEVARFDPVGPEDDKSAEQETDYINYVIQEKNNWFTVAYEWFTDALLTKNAYALAYWNQEKQVETEKYEGKSDEELTILLQDPNVEIVQHSARPMEGVPPQMGPDGPLPPPQLHDVVLRRIREQKGVKICVLPPERCLVAEDTPGTSVRNASFFQYWEMVTISKLRAMGFQVPDDISDDASSVDTAEDTARDTFNEQTNRYSNESNDPSMRKVRMRVTWIQFDYNQDGIAEHRMAMTVGQTILYNDECNGVQVAAIVPTPLPHRHPGLSIRDNVSDLQEIKTALLRSGLDNVYLQNNGRYGISDKVNLDDMLVSRPGGIVRVADGALPGQHIMPFVHPSNTQNVLGVMEYIDRVREHRTGTNQTFTGVDPNALDKAHSGVALAQLSSAAAQRVEMIARVFAEGVKELFLIVHELILKHGRQAETVRLKNEWVSVDPSQWKKRADMKISVGLGTGNKEQLMNNLRMILMAQKEALQIGVSTPENIYNALSELTKAAGFPSAEKFWTKPQAQQQQPNPEMVKAQAEAQKEQMKQQAEMQRKQMEIESAERIRAAELQHEQVLAEAERQHSGQLELMKAEMQANAKPQTQVQVDAGESFNGFVGQFADTIAQATAGLSRAAEMMAQASQAQAMNSGVERINVPVRGPDGKISHVVSRLNG